MTAPATIDSRFAGVQPCLPWPLSAWRWWTEPVGAERLAALRIGLALLLLIDISWTYLPNLDVFFLDSGPSGSRVFGWYTQTPRWTWSVLRGLGDPLLLALILLAWLGTTVGLMFDWLTRSPSAMPKLKLHVAWLAAGLALVGGCWARVWDEANGLWVMPAVVVAAALGNAIVELILLCAKKSSRIAFGLALVGFGVFSGLLALGAWLDIQQLDIPGLARLLRPWQNDALLLRVAAGVWIASAALLLLGWQTRCAAVAAWVLSVSFANLNPNIDNAGDVVRYIILFYLMLCPCGAVWSVDRFFRRHSEPDASARVSHSLADASASASASGSASGSERVVVSPWALRLLFVQLVFIYFMNGLFKLGGANWLSGDSLHYVLCDVTLTRFSYAQFPVPVWVTTAATWTVLAWEVGFPLWVSLRWTRPLALWFGVLFHVGIYATMELGNFAPYVLTLYLPLLPWENLRHRLRLSAREERTEAPFGAR
jgi:vitamin K-dependent gamma-carboxylase-like protein